MKFFSLLLTGAVLLRQAIVAAGRPQEKSLSPSNQSRSVGKKIKKLNSKESIFFFLFIIFFGLPCRKYPSVFSLHHNSLLGAGTPSVLAIITLSHLSPFMPSNPRTFIITSKQIRTRSDSTFASIQISPVQFSTTFWMGIYGIWILDLKLCWFRIWHSYSLTWECGQPGYIYYKYQTHHKQKQVHRWTCGNKEEICPCPLNI